MDTTNTPQSELNLAYAFADLMSVVSAVAWRLPGASKRLSDVVERLASTLADVNGFDDLARSPEEQQAEADQLAALEALGDGGRDDEEAA